MAEPPQRWRSPEELVEIGFDRARVVMMNEAHNGLRRSLRTREIGLRVLPKADACDVKNLALEAITREVAAVANSTRELPALSGYGYLAQPELRAMLDAALAHGWTLHAYEAAMEKMPHGLVPLSMEATNWREDQQARNLAAILEELPTAKLLVWCGNSHLRKLASDEWQPMGFRFREHSGIEHFALDQTGYVMFEPTRPAWGSAWIAAHGAELAARGGAAGFLAEEAPPDWRCWGEDAYVLAELDDVR